MFDGGAAVAKRSLQVGTGAALTLSALGVSVAWPFVAKLYVHQYDPKAFWDGAETWSRAVADVRAARERIDVLVSGASGQGWRSEDGRAFQRRLDAFLEELASIEIRASVVAAVLYTAAVATYAMILYGLLAALTMAALAAWVLIATVTPVSAAGARVLAFQVLMKMLSGFTAVESRFDTLFHTETGVLGALVLGDVLFEAADGDRSGVVDFVQATVSQGPMLIWGTANRVERDLTAYGIDGRFPSGGFQGRRFGSRAGTPMPPGFLQVAGVKGANDSAGGQQTITGPHVPEQNPDGSYDYPWE